MSDPQLNPPPKKLSKCQLAIKEELYKRPSSLQTLSQVLPFTYSWIQESLTQLQKFLLVKKQYTGMVNGSRQYDYVWMGTQKGYILTSSLQLTNNELQILQAFKNYTDLTSEQLSRFTGISYNVVRHELTTLQQKNIVTKRIIGRWRGKCALYSLNKEHIDKQIHRLLIKISKPSNPVLRRRSKMEVN